MDSALIKSASHADPAMAAAPASCLVVPAGSVAYSTDDFRDLANLDMLRTVAVLLVFGDHLARSMKFRGLGDIGHLGVLLFFVHTSLVLMLSIGRLRLSGSRLYSALLLQRTSDSVPSARQKLFRGWWLPISDPPKMLVCPTSRPRRRKMWEPIPAPKPTPPRNPGGIRLHVLF